MSYGDATHMFTVTQMRGITYVCSHRGSLRCWNIRAVHEHHVCRIPETRRDMQKRMRKDLDLQLRSAEMAAGDLGTRF